MRQLVLLRHATAGERGAPDEDFGRVLTQEGRIEAARMGGWLADERLKPDYVLSSSAARALETAKLACKELGIPLKNVHRDTELYTCAPAGLLRRLATLPADARRVLLVGHNPTWEQVALHLTGDEDLERMGLAKGGVVVCDLP